jgi:Domain of unknown function (DUF4845)
MLKRQRGVTLIGWLFLLLPLAVVGYAGLRLTPLYLNYMKVARALNQVTVDFKDAGGATPQAIRGTLEKHFEVNSVDYPNVKDIKVTRDGRAWVVEAAYDDQAPLFANLAILVAFDKSVRIGGGE